MLLKSLVYNKRILLKANTARDLFISMRKENQGQSSIWYLRRWRSQLQARLKGFLSKDLSSELSLLRLRCWRSFSCFFIKILFLRRVALLSIFLMLLFLEVSFSKMLCSSSIIVSILPFLGSTEELFSQYPSYTTFWSQYRRPQPCLRSFSNSP